VNPAIHVPDVAARRRGGSLRIMVVGLRGVVDVQGGIETHARMLYPLLARLGCDIEIVQRSPYYPQRRRRWWRGMRLTYLWSPTTPGLEAGVHSLLAVFYAMVRRPDILHLHAIGPGLLAPLARCAGLRVVVTHHAADYEREKWGGLAKFVLRAGEWLSMQFANRPIVVSSALRARIQQRFGLMSTFIPNGAPKVRRTQTHNALDAFGLTMQRYVLCVARLEPTKRQVDLVRAFQNAYMPGWKLAIVGAIEPGNRYCDGLRDRAATDADIVLTGYQTGTALRELYSHAGLFVLPSSLEGHPIALLEAMSYAVPALASAIDANLAVPLPRERFFPVGDERSLAALLTAAAAGAENSELRWRRLAARVRELYSWRNAAQQTKSIYDDVAGGRRVMFREWHG
jgi:glycosyltransferase involved in cell wall biosynthesis